MGARNATLSELADLLKDQHARKLDVVVPAGAIRMDGGDLVLAGVEAEITETGVDTIDGRYTPTLVCDDGIAEKLNIPPGYFRRMRQQRPDLLDANVNGWLAGGDWHRSVLDHHGVGPMAEKLPQHPASDRKFLIRTFRGQDGWDGIARAFLTDSYKPIDNLDVLMAALDGVKQSGAEVKIEGCDLTDTRMRVRIWSDEVKALAPKLLEHYRSPFGDGGAQRAGDLQRWEQVARQEGQDYTPGDEPVVFAGFEISNSEVGRGAFQIAPRLVVQICRNGLTFAADALRAQHLGAKLDAGVIRWSDDTQRRNLELVTAQARDAVSTFLDVQYVERKLAEIERKAGTVVEDPVKAIEFVTKKLRYTEDRQAEILDHFIRGGQMTAGGVLNAMTSLAQTIDDADTASELETDAVRAFELVAA